MPVNGMPIMSPLDSERSQKPPINRHDSVPLEEAHLSSAVMRKLTVESQVPSNCLRNSCSFWGLGIGKPSCARTAAHAKPAARASADAVTIVRFMCPPFGLFLIGHFDRLAILDSVAPD